MTKTKYHLEGSCLPLGMPDSNVTVNRVSYGPDAVIGTVTVVNNHTGETYSALEMENSRAGEQGDKPPVPTGIYDGRVRKASGHLAKRIELTFVPGYTAIEMHNGSYPSNSEGCMLVGNRLSTAPDPGNGDKLSPFLSSSKPTLKRIMEVAQNDTNGHPVVSVEVRNMFDQYGHCTVSPTQPAAPLPTANVSSSICSVPGK